MPVDQPTCMPGPWCMKWDRRCGYDYDGDFEACEDFEGGDG